jgi:hypothetical protein
MSANNWLYVKIEEKRRAFETNEPPVVSGKLTARVEQILSRDISHLSSGRRSVRTRERGLVESIYTELGVEVLLLVLLVAKSANDLVQVKQEGLIDFLKRWWETVAHPSSLAKVSELLKTKIDLCNTIAAPQQLPVDATSTKQYVVARFRTSILLLAI